MTASDRNLFIKFQHSKLKDAWYAGEFAEGSTEPWTLNLVGELAASIGSEAILETGSFVGHGTAWLALMNPLASVLSVEQDPERAEKAKEFCRSCAVFNAHVLTQEACSFIQALEPRSLDFAWVDDDHNADHVREEIRLLLPRMRFRGLIVGHDVFGPFGLDEVFKDFGGTCLRLPPFHSGSGVGIIQVR